MSFKLLGLSDTLLKTLKEQNFSAPYPIQKLAIPEILANNDVLGIAKTGSGKTASYALPILSNLQKARSTKNRLKL